MLRTFKDNALTIPVTDANPLWVLAPVTGGVKHLSLWLADDYSIPVTVAAAPGDTVLYLADTSAIASVGTLYVDGVAITYTGVQSNRVTGIPASGDGSILNAIQVPARARPLVTYSGASNLTVTPGAPWIALKQPSVSRFGILGAPLIYSFLSGSSLDSSGYPQALIQVDLEFQIPARAAGVTLFTLNVSPLGTPQVDPISLLVPGVLHQFDTAVHQRFRLFSPERRLEDTTPGFVYGQYRWRDEAETNAHVLVPTQWDLRVSSDRFVSGIGFGDDLRLVDIENSTDADNPHSVYLRINTGDYFLGPQRFYLPADGSVIDVLPSSAGEHVLSRRPRAQRPIFVGTLKLDSEGRYLRDVVYVYNGRTGNPTLSLTGPRFTVNWDRPSITLTPDLSTTSTCFLGTGSVTDRRTFSFPVWPVFRVSRVYLGPLVEEGELNLSSWSYDATTSELTVLFPAGLSVEGRDIYAEYVPAIAAVYEPVSAESTVLVETADLNPAFSGISHGYLYLEHYIRRSSEVDLYCDKPRVVLPGVLSITPSRHTQFNTAQFNQNLAQLSSNGSSVIAFGPVYYENDYALLLATAVGAIAGERIPNVQLNLIVQPDFRGLLNYQDPLAQAVSVHTGGDGSAAFLYTPPDSYGLYIPMESINVSATSSELFNTKQFNETVTTAPRVVLPEPLALQQLYDQTYGWLAKLYVVVNNNPFFGKVGADVSLGEIPYQETGVAGTSTFRSNGQRILVKNGVLALEPVGAYDSNGFRHTDAGFNGQVVQLDYGTALPSDSTMACYFLAFSGRLLIQVQAVDSGVLSNSIMLFLEPPPEVVDESGIAGYLRPNSPDASPHTSGRLDINRLGGAPILPINVHAVRY